MSHQDTERERVARLAARARDTERTVRIEVDHGAGSADAAVFRSTGDNQATVWTTDILAEGEHFLATTPPQLVGRFLAEVNLSDLAAHGARPLAALAAYAVPRARDPAWTDAVQDGYARALEAHGCVHLGGDLKPAGHAVLTGTMLGAIETGPPAWPGARVGDVVVLTGPIGRLTFLADGPGALARERLGPDTYDGLVHDIHARVDVGLALRAAGATAMTDLSDGLGRGLQLLAERGGIDLEVDASTVPLHAGGMAATGYAPAAALSGVEWGVAGAAISIGGDYELVATLAPEAWERAAAHLEGGRDGGHDCVAIGRVVGVQADAPSARIHHPAGTIEAREAGWDGFRRSTVPRPGST